MFIQFKLEYPLARIKLKLEESFTEDTSELHLFALRKIFEKLKSGIFC